MANEKKWFLVKWKQAIIQNNGSLSFVVQDSHVKAANILRAIANTMTNKNCVEVFSVYRVKDITTPLIRIEQ